MAEEGEDMRKLLGTLLAVAVCLGLTGFGVAWAAPTRLELRSLAQEPTLLTLGDAGWSDPTVGTWDPETRTATLTTDLGRPVEIIADNLTLNGNGHTITGSGSGRGVSLTGRSGVTVANLTVRSFAQGFYLSASSRNTLSGNTASGNSHGIHLRDWSGENTLSGNTAEGNSHGIYLLHSSMSALSGNIASGNQVHGIYSESCGSHTLSSNTADDNGADGIYLRSSHFNTLSGNRADRNRGYGLRLDNAINNTLQGNTMAGNRYNFRLFGTTNAEYSHNIDTSNLVDGKAILYVRDATGVTIDSSTNAGTVLLVNCTGVRVEGLALAGNETGLLLWQTHSSHVEKVQATGNDTGIRLRNSSNNTLTGNVIRSNSMHGIWLDVQGSGAVCANNTLTGNSVGLNGNYGIFLQGARNNTLTDNTIFDNAYGVYLSNASGNQVYNNRFSSSRTAQAHTSGGSGNVFHQPRPVGGNYWSDWTGPDADGDGFVDLPYVFTGGRDDLPRAWGLTDTIPPTTTITLSCILGKGGWYRSDVEVSLTAVDNPGGSGVDTTSYSLDGTQWQTYLAPFTVSAEGLTAIYYRSRDLAGNVEVPKSETIHIDKTPPTITVEATPPPNAHGWNNTGVTVHFAADDALSGLDTVTPGVVISTEGMDQSATGVATDLAGNTATVTISGIHIDKTPPTVQGMPTTPPTGHGWHNADVTVQWVASDELSGVDPTMPPGDSLVGGEGAGLVAGPVTVWDLAGNSTTASHEVNIDRTPPTLEFGEPSPLPNAHGWNNTGVSIPFIAGDALSGIALTSPASPLVLASEGRGVSGTVTVVDRAGNSVTRTSPSVNIDRTPPAVVATASTAAGHYTAGTWTNQDVTVSFACRDDLSGVLHAAAPTTVRTEGADQSVSGACTDYAGNSSSGTFGGIYIDKTPPVLTAQRTPPPNNYGWNNTPVTVTFEAWDALSGVASLPAPTTISTQGEGFAVLGTATDVAGNPTSLLVEGINIDLTPPVPLITTPQPDQGLLVGTRLVFGATDDLSGVVRVVGYLDDGTSTIEVTSGYRPSPGVYILTVTATDAAGNQASESRFFAVYDPNGPWVSGNGSFDSPPGAYPANPSHTGKATFSFTCRYHQGTAPPSTRRYHRGTALPSTRWDTRFETADLRFRSAGYDWLAISGSRARFMGWGTINGSGHYGFMVTAIEGNHPTRGNLFRIVIWHGTTGTIVYDSEPGAGDLAVPTIDPGKGRIMIK
jgi:parallel beta-helix repeat protein